MRIVLFFLFFYTINTTYSQAIRKYSNEFLKIGVGGRYLGLGSSLSASEGDPTSVFFNPSGLSTISKTSISAMHNSYFAGIANFDYVGLALPIKENQTAALSFIRFGVDNIPNTIDLYNPDGTINYDNIKSFSIADMALIFSFAKKMRDTMGFSIGGNAKVIHRSYGSFAKAWGFGIDLGAQIIGDHYKLGLFTQDITTTFAAWSFSFTEAEKIVFRATNNEIPSSSQEITAPSIHFGGQYSFDLSKGNVELTPIGKLSLYTDKRNVLLPGPVSLDASLGLETRLWKIAALRFGVNNFTNAIDGLGNEYLSFAPSLGVGVNLEQFDIDYSYTNIANAGIGLYSHVFSATYRFKKVEKNNYPIEMPSLDPTNDVPSESPAPK